jgi:hypothetical protein
MTDIVIANCGTIKSKENSTDDLILVEAISKGCSFQLSLMKLPNHINLVNH